MKNLTSKLIHGNIEDQNDVFRSLKTPIYDSNAFYFESSEQIADAFQGKIDAYMYSRSANPTVSELEKRLTILSGGLSTVCTSSGMFAISSALLSVCAPGDHIISSPYLFGHSYSLLNSTFAELGINTSFVNIESIEELEHAITDKTRVIFLENIANPQLIVFDVDAIAAVAKKHNILLVIDNTLATSYIFNCQEHGVDIEVLSTTKAISGGATSVGGAVILHKSDKWKHIPKMAEFYENFGATALIKKIRKGIYRNLGGNMAPHNAYLQLLGLETLTLRIDKFVENATTVAEYLQNHSKIKKVSYPGLNNSKYNKLINTQYKGKAGCLINFEMKDKQACFDFMDKLKMIRRATNFCDNKSLVIHPASTIYAEYTSAERDLLLIHDSMIRLSVGIENVQDIIADLEQAL